MRTEKVDFDQIRPSLLGFDQNAAGFLMLTNQLIALRAEHSGNGKLKMVKGPIFPTEIVEERLRKFAATKRTSKIEEAQQRWRQNHA